MSYRYNTIDIAVGVGMCAILFGALLFFGAANGTYQAALPQPLSAERPTDIELGTALLQPALGQAIVDQALFEPRADRAITLAASEWNRVTLARNEFLAEAGGSLGAVMRQAVTAQANHMARVQGIMGQAIVNFTMRGTRNGLLSADLASSPFNLDMIRKIEIRGLLLHHQFASTWQTTLGHRIVEAAQEDWRRAGAIQERLGTAITRLSQAQMESEQVRDMQQEKLGGFMMVATLAETAAERPTSAASMAPTVQVASVSSTEPAAWPEIPLSYLIVAACLLATVFFMGLSLAARSREEKERAMTRRDTSRWVYRMAS